MVLENEGEEHVAMKETTAYFMNTLLQGVINSGTGGSAKFSGMTIAGKTGTTSENYDRYFVGYTPYYVAAVWTGYDSPEKISYSGNPAITMWKKVVQKIHEDLPNKQFSTPSTGLETVEVCLDSGLRPTDACRADVRGSARVQTVTVAAGTAPTESCTMHTLVDYCTEGKCLAGEYCPAESVKQVGVLDYVREDYGESIKADDDAYLLVNMQKAVEETGCPVHTQAVVEPEPEPGTDPSTDPNDPNYDPSGGFGDENMQPEDPTTEPEDPTGGFGDGGDTGWVIH